MNRVALFATLAGVLAVAGGALLRWVTVDYADDLRGSASVSATGRELVPALLPLAAAALAALAATLATRGLVRRLIGVLVGLIGVAAILLTVFGFRDGPYAIVAATAVAGSSEVHRSWIGPLLVVAGGGLLAFAGAVLVVVSRAGGLGSRYERRPAARSDDELHLWRELDAHRDPTVDPSEATDGDPGGQAGR